MLMNGMGSRLGLFGLFAIAAALTGVGLKLKTGLETGIATRASPISSLPEHAPEGGTAGIISASESRTYTKASPKKPVLPPLRLHLIGVINPDEPKSAMALIQDLEQLRTGTYRPGNPVPQGAILETIRPGQVTLLRQDGTQHTLSLQAAEGSHRYDNAVTALASTERLINRHAVKNSALPIFLELSQVQLKPQVVNGKLIGFALKGTAPQGFIEALGATEGDVVAEINGQPLENYRQATQLLG